MKAIFTGLVAVPVAIALMVLFIEHTAFEAPESQTRSVFQIAWSADSRRMLARCRDNESAIGSSAGPLALFDLAGGGAGLLLDAGDLQISSAVLAPDGLHVLAGCEDGRLLWIEIASATQATLAKIPQPDGFRSSVAVSPDGAQAAFASGRVIYVVQTHGASAPRQLEGHRDEVRHLEFSNDGRRLVSAGHDGDVRIWDLDSGQCTRCLRGHSAPVIRAAFGAGGRSVVSAGLDGKLCLWDAERGNELWRDESYGYSRLHAFAIAPEGQAAASSGYDGVIILWDLVARAQKLEIHTDVQYSLDLRFSPDGSLLASADSDGAIRIWDARSGASQATLRPTALILRPENGAD